jgi:branched-chain amino acid transport system permease protein
MKRDLKIYFVALALLAVVPLLFQKSPYVIHILIMCLIWSIVASSWDLLIGSAGIFAFAQIAFYAIGAYTSAVLVMNLNWTPLLGVLIAGFVTAFIGFLIGLPCLKFKGIYIALITYALQMVLPTIIRRGRALGIQPAGLISNIPSLNLFGYTLNTDNLLPWYYLLYFFFALALFAIYRIIYSPTGLAFEAVRDSESLAESSGVNQYKYKLWVFSISAFITGIIGALYVHYAGAISVSLLEDGTFLLVIAMVIIGGSGRFLGGAIGAFTMTLLNEALRPLGLYRMVVVGAIVVLVIILMPQGILGGVASLVRKAKRLFTRQPGVTPS